MSPKGRGLFSSLKLSFGENSFSLNFIKGLLCPVIFALDIMKTFEDNTIKGFKFYIKSCIILIFIIIFIIAFLIIIIFKIAGPKYYVFSKNDLLTQETEILAQKMIEFTPYGSSSINVKSFIIVKLERTPVKYEMSHRGVLMRQGFGFRNTPEQDDYVIMCVMARHGWARNFFLAGGLVNCYWLFDKDGVLKELIFKREGDCI